ncbi:unnamed protein product [Symbiodinium sp. CCMP2592]|nr:unnamed protein product [Symbiodinium sp. CCMP2592]
MEKRPTKPPRGRPAAARGESYAPKIFVYLVSSPPHQLLLGIACLSILVIVLLSLEFVRLQDVLDATNHLVLRVKTTEFVQGYNSWAEARMQENATLGPLEKAVEQGLIVRYARALILDRNGRVLVGRRDAPGLSCHQSYELGAATICKPGEAPLRCSLRALAEEMQSEDAYEFPAAVKEQKAFMLSLDDGSVHQQLVDFVCVWLPDGFPWKSVYTSSWTFDKPAAVQLKLAAAGLWCSGDFQSMMEVAFTTIKGCGRRNED